MAADINRVVIIMLVVLFLGFAVFYLTITGMVTYAQYQQDKFYDESEINIKNITVSDMEDDIPEIQATTTMVISS